ncbi:anion permease [Poriferisphaera sp. WC338]|uniref:inorganic phosphate transporter n=1 Tax=Poriferisphaera sp. WC338 TaxID=3425129 RepID=UPI003D819895
MIWLIFGLTIIFAVVLGFANGANDNAKGVATLVGSKLMKMKGAIIYAAISTGLGSLAAVWIGAELASKFKGKGIVSDGILGAGAFPLCVGIAAGLTVLIATRVKMPISTTHAMVGAIIGIGLAGSGLNWSAVWGKFFYPLLASPLVAVFAAAGLYLILKGFRKASGVKAETCLCVGECVGADGSMVMMQTGIRLEQGEIAQCERKYTGHFVGLSAQRVVDVLHVVSAGLLSFARGLNDTPKVAALMFAGAMVVEGFDVGHGGPVVLIGMAIAVGGVLMVKRVAETMSYEITGMNDGQALSANMTAAFLVIVASKWGVPVSTTHVTCGSLFGIGTVSGEAKWKMISKIAGSWVLTLPVGAMIGAGSWWLMGLMV